jgi:hypothetical protein
MENIDLTLPDAIVSDDTEIRDRLTLIGAPVYAGRIPPDAAKRITRFKAQGPPRFLLCYTGIGNLRMH